MQLGIIAAFCSALLFGFSTPLAKLLVGQVQPWLLAGLLYLGSGVGLGIVHALRTGGAVKLSRPEWGWLLAAIGCGGVLGPLLLMWGLQRVSGSTASLLLNAEGVLTALLAWFAFHENFDRRIATGMAAIVAGAMLLSWSGTASLDAAAGPLAVVAACLCWGLDNNLTRKVALSDPVPIAALKGLVAGGVNTALGLAVAGAQLPSLDLMASAAVLGFFGYGISLVLFVLALRHLGAARAGAYFSLAPFAGAGLSIVLLHDPVTWQFVAAAVLMGVGVWLHLTESHSHDHIHSEMDHDHPHSHDLHHDHDHNPPVSGTHSHVHHHRQVTHAHPHYPDTHHRHTH